MRYRIFKIHCGPSVADPLWQIVASDITEPTNPIYYSDVEPVIRYLQQEAAYRHEVVQETRKG